MTRGQRDQPRADNHFQPCWPTTLYGFNASATKGPQVAFLRTAGPNTGRQGRTLRAVVILTPLTTRWQLVDRYTATPPAAAPSGPSHCIHVRGSLSWRSPVTEIRSNAMSKKAAEHHKKASEHHTHAAHHHGEAAKHYESGQHEKGAHHAHTARGHATHARYHSEEAAKAHTEEHGKKWAASRPSVLGRPINFNIWSERLFWRQRHLGVPHWLGLGTIRDNSNATHKAGPRSVVTVSWPLAPARRCGRKQSLVRRRRGVLAPM